MLRSLIYIFTSFSLVVLGACSEENQLRPTELPEEPKRKASKKDQLHCTYSYLAADDGESIEAPEKKIKLTWEEDETGQLEFNDDFSRVVVKYETERDTSNLKDVTANTGKSVALELLYQNSNYEPDLWGAMTAKVKTGWNMWNIPINLEIAGQKYNRVSLRCGFFSN